MENCRELIEEYGGSFIVLEGFDDCILGIAHSCGKNSVVVYDEKKILNKLISQGISPEDAREFYEYNILGSSFGEETPWFLDLFETE